MPSPNSLDLGVEAVLAVVRSGADARRIAIELEELESRVHDLPARDESDRLGAARHILRLGLPVELPGVLEAGVEEEALRLFRSRDPDGVADALHKLNDCLSWWCWDIPVHGSGVDDVIFEYWEVHGPILELTGRGICFDGGEFVVHAWFEFLEDRISGLRMVASDKKRGRPRLRSPEGNGCQFELVWPGEPGEFPSWRPDPIGI